MLLGYRFDGPDSRSDEKLKRQLQYHIAARQGPMTGLSSQWDYETGSCSATALCAPFTCFFISLGTWKK